MSVFSEITRIKAAKEAIRAAIEAKGVSVGEGTLDTYADKIGYILQGDNGDLIKLIDGSLAEFDIPKGTTRIKAYLFCTNGSIKKVNVPDTVTSIGGYAFNGCGRLMSITIPDSVELIDNFAFRMCPELTEITIGKGVTNIGTQSLDIGSSSKKATIIMKPTTPPVIQSNTIGANVEKIIVPAASLNAYLTATNWAAYSSIIEANAEDAVVERWIINANPSISDDCMYDIAVSSGNEIFKGIYLSTPTAISYRRVNDDLGSAEAFDEASGWTDQAYRTLDFYEHPTGGLLAWLQENAVQIFETWVLDKNTVPVLSDEYGRIIEANIRFLSNDTTFGKIDGRSGDLYYDSTKVYDAERSQWDYDEYKTLHFMESPMEEMLVWWLQTNGTKLF